MPVLDARFAHCPRCGHLILVDALNPAGACTHDCGGRVLAARNREEGQDG